MNHKKSRIDFRKYFEFKVEFTAKLLSFKGTPWKHWKLSTSSKSVWSNDFWYVKVCIFWKYIEYTTHWDKTQMLKKLPSNKISGTKNALFFLSQALTHNSFTFNLRFLYELKHKVHLSKTVCGIFYFRFLFILINVYTFVQQNAWTLWL